METGEIQHDRTILRIRGADARDFLQGLITNNVAGIDDGAVYSALLTPQGKYIADFFLIADGQDVLMDLPAALAPAVAQKLTMYKLRAAVTIEESGLAVTRGLGDMPEGAVADPRHPDLGWRLYGPDAAESEETARELERRRIALGVPASGVELVPNDTYILEARLDRFHGVDFKKGCFVGQEIVARMKHKLDLRKGLVRVTLPSPVPVGTEITRDDKTVGTVLSQLDGIGLAHVRFDRAGPGMAAGEVPVTLMPEDG